MICIDADEFWRLRKKLSSVRNLNVPGYSRGMLFTILSQKKVDSVKRYYPKVVEKLDSLRDYWRKECKMPGWMKLTPVMRVRLLMKSLGLSKAEINRALNDPERILSEVDCEYHPERLEEEVWKALYTDYVYSPLAVRHQRARGELGEEIIREWLTYRDIEFSTERDLRGRFSKTPDFFFEEPVRLNGSHVRWIESKALFGDPKTHWVYLKKQFSIYREMFGEGHVVYWFGCVKDVREGILTTDVFSSTLKNALNDMLVYTAYADRAEELAEKLNAVVVDLGAGVGDIKVELGENVRSVEFLEGVGKVIDCYSMGRLVIADGERDWRNSVRKHVGWVLRNMGFAVIHV